MDNIDRKIQTLKDAIHTMLPELEKAMDIEGDVVTLHQDAFAADYQPQEYLLLGMAIKYLGLLGKTITIIGTNGETMETTKNAPVLEK